MSNFIQPQAAPSNNPVNQNGSVGGSPSGSGFCWWIGMPSGIGGGYAGLWLSTQSGGLTDATCDTYNYSVLSEGIHTYLNAPSVSGQLHFRAHNVDRIIMRKSGSLSFAGAIGVLNGQTCNSPQFTITFPQGASQAGITVPFCNESVTYVARCQVMGMDASYQAVASVGGNQNCVVVLNKAVVSALGLNVFVEIIDLNDGA